MIQLYGFELCIIELIIAMVIFNNIYSIINFIDLPKFVFYWIAFSILVCIYEIAYLYNFKNITRNAKALIKTKNSIWFEKYDISKLLPWKFAKLFYTDYIANSDREYINNNTKYGKIIESTHLFICGGLYLLALIMNIYGNINKFKTLLFMSFGAQIMNIIMYTLFLYFQIHNKFSSNYASKRFPIGRYYEKRPFTYINIIYIIMIISIIIYYIIN